MAWVLILTVFVFVGIGLWFRSRTKTFDGYILADRQIPWLLIAGSLAATDIGAGASFGLIQNSANGEGLGTAWIIWMMIPSYLIGSFVAPTMRSTGAKTIPDFFRIRYGTSTRVIATFLVAIPTLGIVAVNLTVASNVVHALVGLPIELCYALVTAVTVLYTYAGGLWADAVTDAIQMVLILTGFAVATIVFHFTVAPLSEVFAANRQSLLPATDLRSTWEFFALFALYSANFLVGLSTVTRMYSGESGIAVRRGILLCLPIYLVYGICPGLMGIYLRELAVATGDLDANHVVLLLVNNLPALAMAILAAGLISAMLSTVDTLLLGSATILVNDLVQPLSTDALDDTREMQLTRGFVIALGVASAFVSYFAVKNVLNALFFVLSVQTSALFAPFVFGHFSKRLRATGANVVIVVTALAFFAFKYFIPSDLSLTPFLLALLVNATLFVVLTWLGRPARTEREA